MSMSPRWPGALAVALTLATAAGGRAAPVPENTPEAVMKKLEGKWKVVSAEEQGKPFDKLNGATFTFKGKSFRVESEGAPEDQSYTVDPARKPAAFDFMPDKEKTIHGIYLLEGDRLKLCIRTKPGEEAPKEFKTAPGSDVLLVVLQRSKP